jgi:tetraacyldisaccharide 4'-kinase
MIKKGFQIQDILLYPLTLLYGMSVWIRNRLFDYKFIKSNEYTLPIISVGNITVGGTGKTPHIEYLIRLLKYEFKIATLSRGYKRKTSGFFLGSLTSSAEEIGDEPRQLKQKFPEIAVAVDGNRHRGINKLLKLEQGLNTILLDDAFQHRHVTCGLSILLVDYNRPISSDFLLPLGRLREPASERLRADVIIVTKCPKVIKPIDKRLLEKELIMFPYQKIFFTTIEYSEPEPVFRGSTKPISFESLKQLNPALILLAGIANPELLKEHLQVASSQIKSLIYPDHYNYTARDMHELIETFSSSSAQNKFIITTEKDAMRLQHFTALEEEIKAAMYYIPIHVEFLENEGKNFNHLITNYVRNNKPDSILHQPNLKKQT